MSLDSKQKKALKSQAHHLKTIIRIGQHGVSENVIAETNNALNTHELIKVHIEAEDRDERLEAANTLTEKTGSDLVTKIGKVFVLYRKNKDV